MSGASPQLSVDEFFRPGGVLAARLPGWEDRAGQYEMASEVAAALEDQRHLIVEAGTGTGKTLAYLVPLILASKRAVVSTGTKNLQDQLIQKDVPLLEHVLGHDLQVAVMKGRNNFLCLQKLADAEQQPALEGLAELTDFGRIREWADRTETGDRAELHQLAAESTLWPKLDARREMCTGKQCALFDRCFITRMHQRAREADIIVVNHHLFFADLALRQDDFGSILPSHQVVVFDEAHEIEHVAGQHFGVQLSSFQFDELSHDIQASARGAGSGTKKLDRALGALRGRAREFFALFREVTGRVAFSERSDFRTRHAKQYTELLAALDGVCAHLRLLKDPGLAMEPLKRRALDLQLTLRTLLDDIDATFAGQARSNPVLSMLIEDERENFVYWLEKRSRGVFLQATPIDVSPILEEMLFGQAGSAVLASATLAVEGSFEYMRTRLGLSSCRELVVPGHFDYPKQVLLYVPEDMPDPKAEAFSVRAAAEILRLVRLSRGRAFVLFTSYQQMRRVHQEVSYALEYPCLMQGQGPNSALLGQFRTTPNCVLFATSSFWQGVDVPGEQLSCVIVDKLPFAVPSDPVVGARIQQIRRDGGNPFREYQIPAAVLALKQGFGRLIRSASDRGVLALLDNRVVKKLYGKIFLDSLPDYASTNRLRDVEDFFDALDALPTTFNRATQGRPRPRTAGRGR